MIRKSAAEVIENLKRKSKSETVKSTQNKKSKAKPVKKQAPVKKTAASSKIQNMITSHGQNSHYEENYDISALREKALNSLNKRLAATKKSTKSSPKKENIKPVKEKTPKAVPTPKATPAPKPKSKPKAKISPKNEELPEVKKETVNKYVPNIIDSNNPLHTKFILYDDDIYMSELKAIFKQQKETPAAGELDFYLRIRLWLRKHNIEIIKEGEYMEHFMLFQNNFLEACKRCSAHQRSPKMSTHEYFELFRESLFFSSQNMLDPTLIANIDLSSLEKLNFTTEKGVFKKEFKRYFHQCVLYLTNITKRYMGFKTMSSLLLGKTSMTATGRATLIVGLFIGSAWLLNSHLDRKAADSRAHADRVHQTTEAAKQRAYDAYKTDQATWNSKKFYKGEKPDYEYYKDKFQ